MKPSTLSICKYTHNFIILQNTTIDLLKIIVNMMAD
jgi:hypothetical protein